MDGQPATFPEPSQPLVRVVDAGSLGAVRWGSLSDFFDPFLPQFVRAALRGGGEVWVSQRASTIEGLFLYNDAERVGSVFTRSPAIAEALFGLKEHLALFSELPLGRQPELFHIYGLEMPTAPPVHRFAHRVRIARAADQPAVLRLLREMYGRIDTSWVQSVPSEEEQCLVVEFRGEVAGAGWVSVVQGQGRFHSLSVRPPYRRLGVGTDLWHARLLWARHAGARRVISEISDHNVASQAIATAGGMQRIGRMFLSVRP